MRKLPTCFHGAAALLGLLAAGPVIKTASPTTHPAATYRMVAEPVEGVEPRQWVLVVVTPEHYAWVSTPEALESCIGRRIVEGSTLEWVPQDVRRGGEPLTEERDLTALRKFCEMHPIKFVHVPAG